MKYFLLLLAIILTCSIAQAQLNKAQWIIGGNAGFSYADKHQTFPYVTTSNKNLRLQFSPLAGYFVFDKLCIGVKPTAEWLHRKTKGIETINGLTDDYNSDSKATTLGIGPFVRYYFLRKANKINLLAEASYAYSHEKGTLHAEGFGFNAVLLPDYNALEPLYAPTHNLQVFNFAVGPVIFLNAKTALELLVNYNYSASDDISVEPMTFFINAGFQIHLGK